MDNNHLTETSHAVIYCRHPDPLIPHLDNDLTTQEENCQAYAQNRGYTVETVFVETPDVVAKDHQRPVMNDLLAYLQQHRPKQCVVIIDAITTLGDSIEEHAHYRKIIQETGGALESPNLQFGNRPENRLIETLLACSAENQRKKATESVQSD